MKLYPECYPCILLQAVDAVNQIDIEPQIQNLALKCILEILSSADERISPPAIVGDTNRCLQEMTGINDLYGTLKDVSHELALEYQEALRALVQQGNDPLVQALKIGAAGNIIDVVHVREYDLWEEVSNTVKEELRGGGLEAFQEKLKTASFILYLADNVGETVFDRVLIENLPLPVIYSVKSGPILNDAARVDAVAAGIDQVATIIENGTRSPGTVLSRVSDEFLDLFNQAELVLSKGQANYESLDDQGQKMFFLMRVKCPLIGREIGAPVGSLVLKQGKDRS